MSALDDQIEDYLDGMGFEDDDEIEMEVPEFAYQCWHGREE